FFSAKGGNSAITDGFIRFGDDQIFVNAGYLSKAFAGVAGSTRIIKGEHLRRWFMELHPVHFKAFAEFEFGVFRKLAESIVLIPGSVILCPTPGPSRRGPHKVPSLEGPPGCVIFCFHNRL